MKNLDFIIDNAIHNYMLSEEFWNQFIIFGQDVFDFEMSFENVFLFSKKFYVLGVKVEFYILNRKSFNKEEIASLDSDFLDEYVKINYTDLFLDLAFFSLSEIYYFSEFYNIRKVYINSDTIYSKMSNVQPLQFQDEDIVFNLLSHIILNVDISKYKFKEFMYVIYNDNELDILNKISNKKDISLEIKVDKDIKLDFIIRCYQLLEYKEIIIDLSIISFEESIKLLNTIFSLESVMKDKVLLLNNNIFKAVFQSNSRILAFKDDTRLLMEKCFKYFDSVYMI